MIFLSSSRSFFQQKLFVVKNPKNVTDKNRSSDRQMSQGRVVVEGVHVNVTADEITKTFSQIAPTLSVAPIFSGSHEVIFCSLLRIRRAPSFEDVFFRAQRHWFVSYPDHATAMSAVRNLNGVMMKGVRIKVMLQKDAEASRGSARDIRIHRVSEYKDTIDLIDRAPLHDLWDLMADFNMIPQKEANELLQRDSKLAQAVLQAQIRLGVVPIPEAPRDPRMRGRKRRR